MNVIDNSQLACGLSVSMYARQSSKKTDEEIFIRELPLLVLLHELIEGGALDFDYAPHCVTIAKKDDAISMWLNYSQEAEFAITVGSLFYVL